RSEAYFVFPLAQGTPGKQCGLAATGVYQPSLRSPWLAAAEGYQQDGENQERPVIAQQSCGGGFHCEGFPGEEAGIGWDCFCGSKVPVPSPPALSEEERGAFQ
ncbi:hypothetical protein, partial [Thiolapillus sp.]|uniref:hypothetical protein n=1 Tax=Thiolapillus sp. TaxID=2017437 RepID=UPI0025FB31D1